VFDGLIETVQDQRPSLAYLHIWAHHPYLPTRISTVSFDGWTPIRAIQAAEPVLHHSRECGLCPQTDEYVATWTPNLADGSISGVRGHTRSKLRGNPPIM
jgi:hypothetical protein